MEIFRAPGWHQGRRILAEKPQQFLAANMFSQWQMWHPQSVNAINAAARDPFSTSRAGDQRVLPGSQVWKCCCRSLRIRTASLSYRRKWKHGTDVKVTPVHDGIPRPTRPTRPTRKKHFGAAGSWQDDQSAVRSCQPELAKPDRTLIRKSTTPSSGIRLCLRSLAFERIALKDTWALAVGKFHDLGDQIRRIR